MDYADDDAVRRFELWERAIDVLSDEFVSDDEFSPVKQIAFSARGDSAFAAMKREALINAARIPGNEHLPRLQKAFPGIDLVPFIEALRIKVVILRLEGN